MTSAGKMERRELPDWEKGCGGGQEGWAGLGCACSGEGFMAGQRSGKRQDKAAEMPLGSG